MDYAKIIQDYTGKSLEVQVGPLDSNGYRALRTEVCDFVYPEGANVPAGEEWELLEEVEFTSWPPSEAL